jgi:hypothetical protein
MQSRSSRHYFEVDAGLAAKTAAIISMMISVCYQDKTYSCNSAKQTCVYYGQKLHDPSDVTGCCWWYNAHCITAPPSPGGGGGGGGSGQTAPRPSNSGNGGHKKE